MVSHNPVKLDGHRCWGSENMFLICQMISQDHVTQEPSDFLGRGASR